MLLELDSLQRAVAVLNAALAKTNDLHFMAGLDDVARNTMKAGVIQHFEFTYELCWKFIKRWLEMNISPTAADGVTRRELYRLGAENRLIVDVDEWMRHHDARNETSHTYDPAIAEKVYAAVHAFAHDAVRLLEALESRND